MPGCEAKNAAPSTPATVDPDSRQAKTPIIVAAIVYSKRRAQSMGDEAPAETEISGATAPAVPAELSPKEAAEVNDVPLGHAPEAGALNGHASSPSPQQADKE